MASHTISGPTMLSHPALTTAAIVLGTAWKSLLPAYRALRAEFDGVSDELVVNTRLTIPAMRRRSFGPFRMVASPAAGRQATHPTAKPTLRIQFA